MRSNRLIGGLSIVLMLGCCLGATVLYGNEHKTEVRNSYAEVLEEAPKEDNALSHIRSDFTVDKGFNSHLPLVIIDTNGIEPPINTSQTEDGSFVAIEGLEPYVDGMISIISNDEGINTLSDAPQVSSRMRIKRRGNSSMLYEKAQWMVKLVTESGENHDVDILGMGEEHEWILNGSMFDKSMLRNYLVYSISSEIMPYTPDYKYCEVLVKNGNTYEYRGVYLLGESIKQGENRVNIADYKTGDTFNSYLVRRDRYEEGATMLDTYGRENGLYTECLGLLYPTKTYANEEMISYVEKDISEVERVLYSENSEIFATYSEIIDVDSFVDYFLINEFFGSYDAGTYSTYCYKNVGGKLTMGPVWDFDGTIDNYKLEALETESLAFHKKPWFDRLCRDQSFVEKLEKRYIELRHSSLSEQHVMNKIDEIVVHLGGAQEREWYRWGHWYATENQYSLLSETDENGTTIIRNAVTYENEIYRIKTALREHGQQLSYALDALEEETEETTGGTEKWMGMLLLLAACVFFIPALYVSLQK